MLTRAIAFHRHGGPEVLEEITFELPEKPPAGQVRVGVTAVALNHLDLWVRGGLPHLKLALPHRLGSDIAGTVEAIGDGATSPPVGTKVLVAPGVSCGVCEACLSGRDHFCRRYHILGESTHGGYAELLDVPSANILPFPGLPGAIRDAEAASIPLTFLTAHQMVVVHGAVKRSDVVLIHAAGSGVSVAAIQIAKSLGARVIVTSTSAAKLERARGLGADEVIDTTRQDFATEARKLTGKRGVDVVLDHVGGDVFAKSLVALTQGGKLVTCGATAGPTPQIDLRHVFFRQLSIIGSTMGSRATLFAILREVERGAYRAVVDRVLPFTVEGAREAHRALEAREAFGKIVLSRA